jgi:hypothetical protein
MHAYIRIQNKYVVNSGHYILPLRPIFILWQLCIFFFWQENSICEWVFSVTSHLFLWKDILSYDKYYHNLSSCYLWHFVYHKFSSLEEKLFPKIFWRKFCDKERIYFLWQEISFFWQKMCGDTKKDFLLVWTSEEFVSSRMPGCL